MSTTPLLQKLCKIAQASKNSDSNAQHFLLDLLTHSWFHSVLFALSGYQFPYLVMNRCLYLIYSNLFSTYIFSMIVLTFTPKHKISLKFRWPYKVRNQIRLIYLTIGSQDACMAQASKIVPKWTLEGLR